MSVRQAIKTHGAIAEASIKGELLQMHDMKVWTPIKLTDIPKHMRKGILRTSIFLKEKFLSTGAFEKLKARLVAGGDQQDKSIYTDLSSPTASTASVFAVAALAAQQGREVSIHGKLIAKLKGCSTKQHGPTPDYRPLLTSKGTRHDPQVLEIDLMYVQKVVFLLGVVQPMDYTVVAHLSKGESSAAIQPILEAMVNDLERNGVPISLIRSDPGTNLMKCKRVLQPGNTNNEYIQIDTTAAGEHAERVERKIRTTKERFRTGTNSLPFRLSLFMIVQLILFVVSCLNKETGAYSVYHRRGLDARLDYRVKFGQYVQATEANTDNTPAPRTQGCIALGGLDNLTGGVRMLSLSTLKVVRRNNFETLPMPDLVVDLMDNMAAKDLKDKLITPVAPSPAMDLERTGATQDQSDTGDMPLVPSPPVSTDPMRHPVDQGSEESPPVSTDNIRHPVDYTHEQ